MDIKRKRAVDFTEFEIQVLTDSFVKNHPLLFGKHSNDISQRKKADKLNEILGAINAVGGNNRTLQAVLNKWSDLKKNTKAKVAAFYAKQRKSLKRTGGGTGDSEAPPGAMPELTMPETLILSVIPHVQTAGKFKMFIKYLFCILMLQIYFTTYT